MTKISLTYFVLTQTKTANDLDSDIDRRYLKEEWHADVAQKLVDTARRGSLTPEEARDALLLSEAHFKIADVLSRNPATSSK